MDRALEPTAELGLRRLARRIRVALFLGGFADALFAVALAFAALLLAARFFSASIPFSLRIAPV